MSAKDIFKNTLQPLLDFVDSIASVIYMAAFSFLKTNLDFTAFPVLIEFEGVDGYNRLKYRIFLGIVVIAGIGMSSRLLDIYRYIVSL